MTSQTPLPALPTLAVGSEVLRDFSAASAREWLAVNGIGGYAMGTLSGASTRQYHALLVAAMTPPIGRYTALSRLEETIVLDGAPYELAANQYPGVIHPRGFQWLEAFEALPAPTFRWRLPGGARLQKEIWMARGRNAVCVRYTLLEGAGPAGLRLAPLVCWKEHNSEFHRREGFPAGLEAGSGEARVLLTEDGPTLRLRLPNASWEPAGWWHENIEHAVERERGYDWREDLACPGTFTVMLAPGEAVTFTASLDDEPVDPDWEWDVLRERQEALLARAGATGSSQSFEPLERALVLAADAFVVERAPSGLPDRATVIAGYPWFTDWGRDTMISLPGLCLETGRLEAAEEILRSYAGLVSQGMVPNRWPDEGEELEVNTADATFWFVRAVWAYCAHTGDYGLARDLWPTLREVVEWHVRGTRYNIRMDPEDGLISAAAEGYQLTWMDAKVNGWVVTPRAGKPVEINALWHDALRRMAELAGRIGEEAADLEALADRCRDSFREKFARPDGLALYDVLGPDGPDPAIRPNQILAASLNEMLLTPEQRRGVVDVVRRDLLTPFGLRTLVRDDAAYHMRYGGNQWQRDGAYHQGTVWPWLLGPFVEAWLAVYGNPEEARALLAPLEAHLLDAGIGSLSEVFDGEPPHRPNGCPFQAWSVAETLRALRLIASAKRRAL